MREQQRYLCVSTAWCLRNHGVSAVLLGASRTEQLAENLRAVQVSHTHTHTCGWGRKVPQRNQTSALLLLQVLPKLSVSVLSEVDHLLGNKPYGKKDPRS